MEAVAQPDPDVVRLRLQAKTTARQLRLLRLVRVLSARIAKHQGRPGRLSALRARLATVERALAILEPPE